MVYWNRCGAGLQDECVHLSQRTDQVWRRMRWIEDALQNGRDASGSSVVSLKKLKDTIKSQNGTVRRGE